VTANAAITAAAVHALHSTQKQRRVALVGIDYLAGADLVRPSVSVMSQDAVALGRKSALRLRARIGGETSAAQTILVPMHMHQRESQAIGPNTRGTSTSRGFGPCQVAAIVIREPAPMIGRPRSAVADEVFEGVTLDASEPVALRAGGLDVVGLER
jgi:Periplasmic binding protein-like domain